MIKNENFPFHQSKKSSLVGGRIFLISSCQNWELTPLLALSLSLSVNFIHLEMQTHHRTHAHQHTMHTPTHTYTHTHIHPCTHAHNLSLCKSYALALTLQFFVERVSLVTWRKHFIACSRLISHHRNKQQNEPLEAKMKIAISKWIRRTFCSFPGNGEGCHRIVVCIFLSFSLRKTTFFQRAMKKNEHLLTVHTTEVACFSSSSLRFDSRHSQEFFSCCCEDL